MEEKRRAVFTVDGKILDDFRKKGEELGFIQGYVSMYVNTALLLANNLVDRGKNPYVVMKNLVAQYPGQLHINDYNELSFIDRK